MRPETSSKRNFRSDRPGTPNCSRPADSWSPIPSDWTVDARGNLAALGVMLGRIVREAWEQTRFSGLPGRNRSLKQYLPWWGLLHRMLLTYDSTGRNAWQFTGTQFGDDPHSGLLDGWLSARDNPDLRELVMAAGLDRLDFLNAPIAIPIAVALSGTAVLAASLTFLSCRFPLVAIASTCCRRTSQRRAGGG